MLLDPRGSPSVAALPVARGGLPPAPDELAVAARRCRACPRWEAATQVVFGEGPAPAPLMLVGEVPGDREDRVGRPFVGPAGALLDRALEEAGIARDTIYLTNAVKHFGFIERGKRRLHQKPNALELRACRGWLSAEVEVVRPRLIVCLGATAAQALLGASFRVTRSRGVVQTPPGGGPPVLATHHPSALLRAPDADARARGLAELVADLRAARNEVG